MVELVDNSLIKSKVYIIIRTEALTNPRCCWVTQSAKLLILKFDLKLQYKYNFTKQKEGDHIAD